MNRDLAELGFEFEKLERFNLETATGGALIKEDVHKKSQISQKSTCAGISFLSNRDSETGAFLWILEILNNSFFYRTPLGNSFC